MQTDLFHTPNQPEKPDKLGKSDVAFTQSRSILTKGAGFLSAYDFSLNPYSGCTFGCSYCYAAFFARNKEKQDNWGYWVIVKENALALLRKKRRRSLQGKTIYMSSVTDPYQPIDKKLELTRSLLRELVDYHQPRLVIQTRSPLVTRDIDLLKRFDHLQVNMTITTDSEEVRQAFEPLCPNNRVRLRAIQEVHDAGVSACITLTPLLPVHDPHQFAQDLVATGIQRFIVQPFHVTKGKFVAGTREAAMRITKKYGWSDKRYQEVRDILQHYIPNIGEGQQGFSPPPA